MTDIQLPKILVVDDRPENLFAMEKVLKHLDAEVLTAHSGQEALALILRHEFALILLDVQMPVMDGFETATLIRDHDKTKQIPIIFVTAISKERQHVFKGYEAGAVDYLFKPIEPEILISKAKVFCELQRQKEIIQKQVDEIKTLRGILPLCSYCNKIRDEQGNWERVDVYILNNSEASVSHGICPECKHHYYDELNKILKSDDDS